MKCAWLTGLAQRMLAVFQVNSLARPKGLILGIEEDLCGPVIPGYPDILGRLDLVVETAVAGRSRCGRCSRHTTRVGLWRPRLAINRPGLL